MAEKIVITGGPCGGKSTALPLIRQALESDGLNVIALPETATELMNSGIYPLSTGDRLDFQQLNIEYMLGKTRLFERIADSMHDKRTVILCDRGLCDCKAYMGEDIFNKQISRLGITPITARDGYDAVFHMVSPAVDKREAYVSDSHRLEDADTAAKLDRRVLKSWTGNPHLRVIDNQNKDFAQKTDALLREIKAFLGIPKPLEIERKFLIKMPDIKKLTETHICAKVDIMQTYLSMPDGSKVRIRRRGIDGDYVYIKTEKRSLSDTVREEYEQRITPKQYEELMQYANRSRRPIEKSRYCIVQNGKYFELDIFGFWDDRALLEIELLDQNESFVLPDFADVIKEVTDDIRYRNSALAKSVPYEKIP